LYYCFIIINKQIGLKNMSIDKKRYEVKNGKWGAYFYDTLNKTDLPLNDVLKLLNEYNLTKLEALGKALTGPER